jgi:hypothetical protein
MIYIIISNVGMALMMIIVYLRYSRFRLKTSAEINSLRQKLDKEVGERRDVENQLLTEKKTDSDKIEKLLQEITDLRKEKEGEIRLRIEAEKQIELALHKTDEVQKRMKDWSVVQDAVMRDCKDSIVKIGNDLYKKLHDSYKNEVETNKNLLGRVSKNITDFFEKMSAAQKTESHVKPVAASPAKTENSDVSANVIIKTMVSDLSATMKANGFLVNKDYFLPANFDAQKAKTFVCEVAFIALEELYMVDFKACAYFEEYRANKDKTAALDLLKQRLDKYISYIGNARYHDSILKVMATTKAKFEKSTIVVAVSSNADLQLLKEIGYHDKLHKVTPQIMDFDGVNNLVL